MKISAKKPYKLHLDYPNEIYDLEDQNFGLCLYCGEESHSCEPDAYRYTCESCGTSNVYGTMHLVFGNRVVFDSNSDEDQNDEEN